MKCEQCGKVIPDVFMVRKGTTEPESLSNLAKVYHIYCSDKCQRLKKEQDWKKNNPYR
jgi:hypothetical protein